MYKYKKGSIQLIRFQEVFGDQLVKQRIGFGLIALFSILIVGISFSISISNLNEGLAQNSQSLVTVSGPNGCPVEVQANQTCYWECYPCDMTCYTKEDELGPCQFRLKVDTGFGWAIGLADCKSPGLCAPGNYDIRGSKGVPGDSHGYCNISYLGYWVEDDGYIYTHWSCDNYGTETTKDYQNWVGEFKMIEKGGIEVRKKSNFDLTSYLNGYSFKNCIYDIYATYNDALNRINRISYLSLDESGYAKSGQDFYANGTYYVRESNRPGEHGTGYNYNDDIGHIVIPMQNTDYVIWSNGSDITYDEPYFFTNVLSIIKTDCQTGEPGITEGSVESFEGAYYQFDFKGTRYQNSSTNLSAIKLDYSWLMSTDENGEVGISEKYRQNKIDGDKFIEYKNQIVCPFGDYFVYEVKPPEGYLLSEKIYKINAAYNENAPNKVKITIIDTQTGLSLDPLVDPQKGTIASLASEQIIRGDYKFTKVNDKNETLSGIPFKITSNSTGEWHICVTDQDGIIDSSYEHYPHSNNTNYNDILYDEETNTIKDEDALSYDCGIWFAFDKKTEEVAKPNDSVGAFPYDSYTIEEIQISKNEKYLPFEKRTFIVDNHGYLIEGPEWVNKEPIIPVIPINEILPKTGDISLWIFGLPILAVLCYIMRRWAYYRKY